MADHAAGGAGGALVVTVPLAGCASSPSRSEQLGQGGLANGFIRITPASDIEFYLPRAEMGQGVVQGLTVLVAEELSTAPGQIDVQFAKSGSILKKVTLTDPSGDMTDIFFSNVETNQTIDESVFAEF